MEKRKIWKQAAVVTAAALGGWLALWLLGPVLLPFAAGLVIAGTADPAVRSLHRRGRLPRWAASGLCVTAVYAVVILAVIFLCQVLCRELMSFVRTLPALAQSLAGPVERLKAQLLQLAARFPDGIGAALREGVSEFFRSGAGLGEKLYNWVFDLASAVLAKTPDIFLFLLTAVLSSFMFSARLPELRQLWQKKLPKRWRLRTEAVARRLKTALGGWCKAQLKLMGVTFLVITAGLLILGMDYALLFGLVIAFIDALPVFGAGAVLIPWGLVMFLQGNTFWGVGLLCLYGASALVRSALEPQLLGKQIGLDPLLTLLAIYTGFRFFGVAGMVLFPIVAMLAKQLWNHLEKGIDNEGTSGGK